MSRNPLRYASFLSVSQINRWPGSLIKTCFYCGPFALLLFGCLEQLSSVKQPAPPRNLGITAETPEVRVEIVDIIEPGDPTSWVDNARWTEVIVRLANISS